jgi:hypothetical protein
MEVGEMGATENFILSQTGIFYVHVFLSLGVVWLGCVVLEKVISTLTVIWWNLCETYEALKGNPEQKLKKIKSAFVAFSIEQAKCHEGLSPKDWKNARRRVKRKLNKLSQIIANWD